MTLLESLRTRRLALDPAHTWDPVRLPSPQEVMNWFSVLQAGWVHNGDPAKPHAKLHSGKCSTGFFLCKRVLKYGNLREILAACIIQEIIKSGLWMGECHGVFGSPYSSILLAGEVARLLNIPIYVPEKDPKDPEGKRMIFKPDDPIPEGSSLLQIEELVTTWASGDATKQAIITGNPFPVKFTKCVGVLVHRPDEINRSLKDGRVLVPFIEKQVDAWDPAVCPLCKANKGSVPLLPKSQWAKLTA